MTLQRLIQVFFVKTTENYFYSTKIMIVFLGDIPLRQLVYRVHPLPESMKPLVWDFGSLTNAVEVKYSKQIIDRSVRTV